MVTKPTAPVPNMWLIVFIEKYLIPLFLVGSIGLFTGGVTLWLSVRDMTETIKQQSAKQSELEARINRVEANMIGWDTLKRIELMLTTLAKQGRGNEAMAAVANVLGSEVRARENRADREAK
jgi:hypothetical protein